MLIKSCIIYIKKILFFPLKVHYFSQEKKTHRSEPIIKIEI